MQTKKFKVTKDCLEVVIINNGDAFMMDGEEKKIIGNFVQTTIQKIDKEQIQSLVEFTESELKNMKIQLEGIETQLDALKDIDENKLSPEVEEACRKQIDKGTKVFKQKMLVLNNHLAQSKSKKQLISQKEFMAEQVKNAGKELANLKEAVK